MKIRTITPFLLAGALLAGAMASGTALAQHRFHGGPRVGVYIGGPRFPYSYSPYYYSASYYAPPAFVAPPAPTVDIQQAQPPPPPAPPARGGALRCSLGLWGRRGLGLRLLDVHGRCRRRHDDGRVIVRRVIERRSVER